MRLERQLKIGPKNPTGVHNVNATGVPDSEVPPPPTPDMSAFQANIGRSLERMVNAALSKDGKTTDRGRSGTRTPTGGLTGRRRSEFVERPNIAGKLQRFEQLPP